LKSFEQFVGELVEDGDVVLKQLTIYDDVSFTRFVIPGLAKSVPYWIRGNPVFSWIPAGVYPVLCYGAGMTPLDVTNDAVCSICIRG